MHYMLCRNKVRDYEIWRQIFDSHASAHRASGLTLLHMWRSVADRNTIYFLFALEDLEKGRAFVSQPDNAGVADPAGVLEGEIVYLEGERLY